MILSKDQTYKNIIHFIWAAWTGYSDPDEIKKTFELEMAANGIKNGIICKK